MQHGTRTRQQKIKIERWGCGIRQWLTGRGGIGREKREEQVPSVSERT